MRITYLNRLPRAGWCKRLNQALVLVVLLCAYESSFGRAICLTEWRIQGGQSGRAWMPPRPKLP